MNALRARVNALCRKMALPLAVLRIRRLADEFSLECAVAYADRRTPPDSHDLILRVASAGYRLPDFMAVYKYLNRCRSRNAVPETEDIVNALLPWSRLYPPPRFA